MAIWNPSRRRQWAWPVSTEAFLDFADVFVVDGENDRIAALLGIAAAPDFTDWGFADGDAAVAHGLARGFWESGQRLRVLGQAIALECPVRLLHGEMDQEVPLDVAFRLMRALRSSDVQLNVLKGGGHRLSEPHEIRAILTTLAALLEPPS